MSSSTHFCGAADGLDKSLFGQNRFSHLPFVFDCLSFPLQLLGLQLFLENLLVLIQHCYMVLSDGQRFELSLASVRPSAVRAAFSCFFSPQEKRAENVEAF